jgi:hypothetical protein
MATLAAKAQRGVLAREALTQRMEALSARLDVPMPPAAPRSFDPELQPILETERQIAFLDGLLASLTGLAHDKQAPAGYDALTVAQLTEDLMARGIEIPRGARKPDLVALLEADDAAPEDGADEADADEDQQP